MLIVRTAIDYIKKNIKGFIEKGKEKMKEFTLKEQIYICKNANSKTLEQIAIATVSTITDVRNEFNIMKKDGRYEKYRKMSDIEIQQLIDTQNNASGNEESSNNNTLLELNKYLFDELRSLMDESLSEEELNRELKISKQVVSVSQTIINNANLLLQAKKTYRYNKRRKQ